MATVYTFNEGHSSYCNSHLLILDNKQALLFDCGLLSFSTLSNYLARHELTLKGIYLTHGHFDHIVGLASMPSELNVPVYCHFEEVEYIENPKLNCSRMFGSELSLDINPTLLNDGDIIKEEGVSVQLIHTPFHTRGSSVYYLPELGLAFSGDTLFHLSIGRSDLPGGSTKTIDSSLRKLLRLPDETVIYPGHERKTTLATEKAYNPYLKALVK